jgi:hypothetical protein
MFDATLKSELIAMAERDECVRAELAASGELFGGYNKRMASVHIKNATRLDQIIDENGWPGCSMVGNEGAKAAWLILMHAIGNPSFQRKCLVILKEAVKNGEALAAEVACLEDRICVFEGRPQRYGTQFDWDGNGVLSPHPLQDPDKVDQYRESVGLGALSEKALELQQQAAAEGHEQPNDFCDYRESREAWARSVGWRCAIN